MKATQKLGLDITGISKLENLNWLNLISNIKLNGYEEIFDLKKLKSLYLSNDGIEEIKGIKNLEQLETLSLASNNIVDISELKNLENITSLKLNNNKIEDISKLNIDQYTKEFTLENQNIAKTIITENLNYEYPNIIKNAKLANSPIYSSDGLEFNKCSENLKGTGITLKANKMGQVRVKSGLAKGTVLSITPIMKVITDIKVTKTPTRINYIEGQNFDSSGMEITATYNDGTTKVVTGYTITDGEKLTRGKTKVTINYTESGVTKTTTQAIKVTAISLSSIAVKTKPTKTSYYVGDTLDLKGLVLEGTNNNGSKFDITSGYTANVEKLNTAGKQTITVTYNGKTTTFEVTVTAISLSSIAVKTKPTKLSYYAGDTLDLKGLVLEGTNNNGSKFDITSGYTANVEKLNTAGKQTITVTYNGKTTTFEVTVMAIELSSIEITNGPTKAKYVEGENFDNTGMKITAKYNNGSTKEVTNYSVTDGNNLTADKTSVTISYTENNVTKTTTQTIEVEKKEEPEEIMMGDISGNKQIDPNDYIAILRHIAAKADATKQKWTLSEEKKKIADVTGDGKIDLNDVIKLKRYIAAQNDKNVAKVHPTWLNL